MSAAVAAAVKAAIAILSNEEARKKVGWGIVAILSPLIVLVVLLCAILSGTSQHNVSAVELCFHGGSISASATPEYRRYIEDMRNSFDQLDEVIAEINSQCEDGKSLDDTRVKAIFYALYFAAEQPDTDGIHEFADCFVDYEERTRTVTTTDEEGNEVETTETYMVAVPIEDLAEIYERISHAIGVEVTADHQANADGIYKTLHNELGLTNQEIEAMGFDLAHRYEPDCDDAYQDIVDYIRFEQETSKMWPWLISGDEMLAQETILREIAGRLTAVGEWDTESIYESLTEAFGNNLSLDKQSKDDTKEEERNINIKQDQLDLLWQLEEFRKKHEHQAEPSDWAIRMCEAFVARSMGFTDRVQWTELLRQKGETLFTFDWKSGSVSDHVVQWCKENNRNWRYSHLGELQVAHGGEWRKVDYFCRDGSEIRVYFPPEPVQEQQLHALAEAPAVHLRDLLTLGLPDHDVYLVHAAEDVGWVPAADLPRLTAQGKEEFSALLDAKIAAIRPGPYGVELVLDGVNSQLLAQYDETLANSSRAEHAMELFL